MNKTLILLLLILTLSFIASCTNNSATTNPGVDYGSIRKECQNLLGTWLEDPKECEGISEKDCTKLGGKFNECASACRNDPKAAACTKQCVIVCQFS